MVFIETRLFTRRLYELAGAAADQVLRGIQEDLLSDPLRGRIVPGLGGIRKARKGNPLRGKGKSGGFRYFYFYLEHRGRIHLMRLIDKNEQEDLSSQERDVIQRQVAALKTL